MRPVKVSQKMVKLDLPVMSHYFTVMMYC